MGVGICCISAVILPPGRRGMGVVTHFDVQNGEWWSERARQARYRSGLLSEALGISQRQLQRIVKSCFGCSPYAWLNGQRLKSAGDLLKKCHSVKSVCFDLDFKQPSHFSRQFKRYYGLSPSTFLGRHGSQNGQPKEAEPWLQQLNFGFMSRLDTQCPT
jgi:AraC-like DNA-binding protein